MQPSIQKDHLNYTSNDNSSREEFSSISSVAPLTPDNQTNKYDSYLYENPNPSTICSNTLRIQGHHSNISTNMRPGSSSLPTSATSLTTASSLDSPIRAHTITPHSNSYSVCNSSHPPSNEMIVVESPVNIQQQIYVTNNLNPHQQQNIDAS